MEKEVLENYSLLLNREFETEEELDEYIEHVPAHKLRKLGRELNVDIYGPDEDFED